MKIDWKILKNTLHSIRDVLNLHKRDFSDFSVESCLQINAFYMFQQSCPLKDRGFHRNMERVFKSLLPDGADYSNPGFVKKVFAEYENVH